MYRSSSAPDPGPDPDPDPAPDLNPDPDPAPDLFALSQIARQAKAVRRTQHGYN